MKNLFLTMALSLMIMTPALAENVEVEAMSDFSTANPPHVYSVKVVNSIATKRGIIESGSIIEGSISTTEAKRLKRDATFTFTPKQLITPEGETITVKRHFIGNYRKEINKGQIAKSVALSAGNFVVKGFSTGYTAIEGAVKNEEGNVIKSSAKAVYESTPLSYAEKGKDLEIKQGEHFYINFEVDE